MNVGSVWAASGDITASATAGTDTSLTAITADSESYLYYYSMPSVSTAADTEISATDSAGNTYTGSVKLTSGTVSFAINGTSLTGQKASSKAGSNVIRGLKAGQTVVFDLYMNAASACTMSFKAGSTAKTSPDTTLDLGSAKAPFQVSVDINTDMDLYFYNDQQLAIANIGVKTSAAAVDGEVTLTETGAENGVTTVTVGGEALVSGTTYAADSAVVISAVPNDGYKATVTVNDKEVELKNNAYSFNVDGDAVIAVTYEQDTRSAIKESFDLSFSKDTSAGEDLGNGVYSVDALTYSSNNSFSSNGRTGYITNTTNPTDANGTTGSSIGIPVKGSAIYFVSEADGLLTVDYYVGSGKTMYIKSFPTGDESSIESVSWQPDSTTDSKTFEVQAGYTYYFFGQGTKARYYGVTFVKNEPVTISGTVSTTGDITAPTQLIFTEKGTDNAITADVANGSYSVTLTNGRTYEVTCNDSTLMLTAGGEITVSSTVTTHNVTIASASEETVTGTVVGLDDPSQVTVTFTKGGTATDAKVGADGTYTVELQPGTYSVSATAVDGYTISSLSVDDFTVKQSSDATAENWNNILYTKTAAAVTSSDVYVGYADKENNFATITEAMDAINVSSLGKYTVHIAPGTYQEQVIVKANNVTLTNDNAGEVVISWYYGIDYAYYSCNSGYYSKAYAVDKHAKGTPDRWGATVRVTGGNFLAEGITFENSFNRRQTEAEIADGVTALGAQGNTSADRTAADFVATAGASTERAAALVLDSATGELYNCKMLSSQDTLYLNTGAYYFNKCTIQGQTDYIFGNVSKAVFDDCNLVWAGYTSGTKAGYITAARGSMLFRNCTISTANDINGTVTPGYLGRHWGDGAKVIFADTKGMDTTTLVASDASGQTAYFADPSGLTKTAASAATEFYVTTDTDYSAGQKYTEPTNITAQTGTDSTVLTADDVKGAAYLGTFSPVNYAFEVEESSETTATWDFKTATPSTITSVNIQGTTGTVASNVDGIELAVDATVTSGKLQYNASGYAQFNSGTIIKVPVYAEGDTVTVEAYPGQYKYTVGGTAATADTTTYSATAADAANGYIEIVATGGAYIYSITLVTSEPPVVAVKTTANWDFQNAVPSTITSVNIEGTTGTVASNVDDIELAVDATSGKLAYNTSGYAQFNSGTIIKVPVYAEGDTVTVVSYPGQYNYTVGGTAADANTTTYSATAEDAANGYVEIVATSTAYIYGITLVTTGTPSTVTNVFVFDSVVKGAEGTVYVIGKVAEADLAKADKVGFGAGLSADSAKAADAKILDTSVVADEVVDGETIIRNAESGYFFASFTLSGLADGNTFFVVPFTTVGDTTVYGEAETYTYSAN